MTRTGNPIQRLAASPLAWLAALLGLLIAGMPALSPIFAWAFPEVRPPVFAREGFAALWLSHATIVAASSLASAAIALGAGILVTRPAGRPFRAMADTLATIGQTMPPVAVLALSVPALGYGLLPTFVALTLYGFLPILENAIAGLDGVPAELREAARGMGLSPFQQLRDLELRLAGPTILAGVRTSVIINIGTATIGSTVGARTLGTPIIEGLVGDKLPYVLQGAAVVGLFAIVVDMAFARWERHLRRHLGEA